MSVDRYARYRDDPEAFFREQLRMHLYSKQIEIVQGGRSAAPSDLDHVVPRPQPHNMLATPYPRLAWLSLRCANGMPAARLRAAEVVDPRHEPDPAQKHVAKRGDQHTDGERDQREWCGKQPNAQVEAVGRQVEEQK